MTDDILNVEFQKSLRSIFKLRFIKNVLQLGTTDLNEAWHVMTNLNISANNINVSEIICPRFHLQIFVVRIKLKLFNEALISNILFENCDLMIE